MINDPFRIAFANRAVLAFVLNISGYFREIAPSAGKKNQPWHSTRLRRLSKPVEMPPDVLTYVVGSVASTFCDRRIELVAQCGDFGLLNGEAHGVLGSRESSGGDFSRNPMGGVWRQFDFHGRSVMRHYL